MWINVSQLLKAPIGSIRDYEADGIIDVTGNDSQVQGEVRLIRTDRGILVKGELHTEVEVTCSRCLSPFSCPLKLNIEEEYFPIIDVVSGVSLPSPDEPSCFLIDERHVLDLTEAMRQYALLAIPMKPICREDCAGLCPDCGHNLNEGSCNCPPQETNPRWAKLRKLVLTNDEQ
ncbi:hypothetical protein ES703_106102 [subsurface metagenome]